MDKGKLYKSVCNGLVVKCTIASSGDFFGGVVVERGESEYLVGQHYNGWFCPAFKEYTPAQTNVLTNGRVYDIPRGCKATVKNGQVLIESGTKYIKHNLEDFTIYSRHISGGKTTIVTFYCHGDVVVERSLEMSSADISDCGKEIDEDVFVDAYKRALKNLEL